MPYQAVIFDLFGTLVPPFPASVFERTLLAMAQELSLNYVDFQRMWDQETWYARATGEFASVEANINSICESLKVVVSLEQVSAAAELRYEFSRTILHPRADTVETLRLLRAFGLKHALITDCSVEIPELWNQTLFAELIDFPVFSCCAGMKKPQPEIYHLACQGLGIEPKACLYVGDGSSQELQGAIQVGMDAILIAPPEDANITFEVKEWATWPGKRIQSLSELVPLLTET